MPIRISFRSPKYPNDLIHIDRWMCPNCGLIFDFDSNHSPSEPGWIDTDPPWDQNMHEWTDDKGITHFEEGESREICPRCGISLEDRQLVRIQISRTTNLDDFAPIIEQGEHSTTEFKEELPRDADELGKEIASFATSAGGRIFLGIDKKGVIRGYEGIDSPEGKDGLQQRIRGIVRNIDPKPLYQVDFAFKGDKNIAIITVQGGIKPIYYFKGRPYIRDLEESRPANSEEVQNLILSWNKNSNKS